MGRLVQTDIQISIAFSASAPVGLCDLLVKIYKHLIKYSRYRMRARCFQIVFKLFKIIQAVIASKAAMSFYDLRVAAAGFCIFTAMAHIGMRSASHCSVSSNTHICLSTTLPLHAQDSAATCAPTVLNSRYFLSGPRKAWKTEAKQLTICSAQSVSVLAYGYHSDMDPNGLTHIYVYFLTLWL